jgi:ribosomal-protein-alanine N-acetyltransferase
LPRAHANLIDHWSEHGFGPWLVIEKAGQRVIGHCGLRYWPDSTDVEVLYALEPRAWGRGLGTQAARAAAAAAFDCLGLSRLIAGAVTGNQASIAVLRKLGMRRWARREFLGLELEMFSVSRQRWLALGSSPG